MDIIKAATVKEKKIMMEDDPLRLPIFCIRLQAIFLRFDLIILTPFHKKLPVTIVPEWSIRFLALIGNASYLQLDEKKLHAKPSKACTPPPGVQAILMILPYDSVKIGITSAGYLMDSRIGKCQKHPARSDEAVLFFQTRYSSLSHFRFSIFPLPLSRD